MRYDKSFVKNVRDSLVKYAEKKSEYQEFTIDLPDGFADPPVLETCRILDSDDLNLQDRLTRFAILGKTVIVKLDDKQVGSFIMNGLNDKWEAFPVLVQYPLALHTLIETATANITKKLLPPLKNTKPSTAGAAPE